LLSNLLAGNQTSTLLAGGSYLYPHPCVPSTWIRATASCRTITAAARRFRALSEPGLHYRRQPDAEPGAHGRAGGAARLRTVLRYRLRVGRIDLLNAEASVLTQSFFGFEAPTARLRSQRLHRLDLRQDRRERQRVSAAGHVGFDGGPWLRNTTARSSRSPLARPGDPGYNPNVDGTVAFAGPKPGQCAGQTSLAFRARITRRAAGQRRLRSVGGQLFTSEMAALSFNMQNLLAAFSVPSSAAALTGRSSSRNSAGSIRSAWRRISAPSSSRSSART